jgi:hypothetical protein
MSIRQYGIIDYEKIREAQVIITNAIINGDFETGTLMGWLDPASVATVTDKHSRITVGSKYSCNLKHSAYGIIQLFNPPICTEDIIEASIELLAENPTTESLLITFYTTDGLSFGFSLSPSTVSNDWIFRDVASPLQSRMQTDPSYRKKRIYAVQLSNNGTTDGLYIDRFVMLIINSQARASSATLKDTSFTVPAGGETTTSPLGIIPVTPGQVLGLSLEYKSNVTLYAAETLFQLRIDLLNTDGTVKETLTFTPPNRPGADFWTAYNVYTLIPSSVSYIAPYFYFKNAETGSVTINIRNVKAYPTPRQDTPHHGSTGQVTVGTTAVQITTTPTPIQTVVLKADVDNTAKVYWGIEAVSTSSFALDPGEAIEISIDDLSKIRLIAAAAGQKIHYAWLR